MTFVSFSSRLRDAFRDEEFFAARNADLRAEAMRADIHTSGERFAVHTERKPAAVRIPRLISSFSLRPAHR